MNAIVKENMKDIVKIYGLIALMSVIIVLTSIVSSSMAVMV